MNRFRKKASAPGLDVATLESLGGIASIRRGWAIIRRKPADVLTMWLIMLRVRVLDYSR